MWIFLLKSHELYNLKIRDYFFTDLPRKATDEEQAQQFMVCSQGEDQPSKYICLVCSKTYTSRYNIRMHLNMHTGNNNN